MNATHADQQRCCRNKELPPPSGRLRLWRGSSLTEGSGVFSDIKRLLQSGRSNAIWQPPSPSKELSCLKGRLWLGLRQHRGTHTNTEKQMHGKHGGEEEKNNPKLTGGLRIVYLFKKNTHTKKTSTFRVTLCLYRKCSMYWWNPEHEIFTWKLCNGAFTPKAFRASGTSVYIQCLCGVASRAIVARFECLARRDLKRLESFKHLTRQERPTANNS